MPARRLVQANIRRMLQQRCDTMIGTRPQRTSDRPVEKLALKVVCRRYRFTFDSRFLNLFRRSANSGAVIKLLFRF